MEIGILGAGQVGLAVGRQLIGAGHRVKLASARGPQALTPVAQGIGAEAVSTLEYIACRPSSAPFRKRLTSTRIC